MNTTTLNEIEKLATKIKDLESELTALRRAVLRENVTEKKVLELEGGDWAMRSVGDVVHCLTPIFWPKHRTRKTEERAERAAKQALRRDTLAAWVDQHSGHDGSIGTNTTWYIAVSQKGIYRAFDNSSMDTDVCNIYMSEETARWLCEKLNSGEIVLP